LRTQPSTICDQEASHGQEAQQTHGQEAQQTHGQEANQKAMAKKSAMNKPEPMPPNIGWNGMIQCCIKNCPSWIYVRKSNWYHSCQLCGMPLVTSLSNDLPQGP